MTSNRENNSETQLRIKKKMAELYDELFRHNGYGQLEVNIRIMRRGQKEVILRCGKEYRYVVDYP